MMLFGERDTARRLFVDAWRKRCSGEPLEPLEETVASVIAQHPEYHPVLQDEAAALGAEYRPEDGVTNPFLHMGMHIAIHEQLATDRPPGVLALYRALLETVGDPHALEHRMMECLGQILWTAQRSNLPPDEEAYMECLWKIR